MSADCNISGGCWIGLLAGMLMGGVVFAQAGDISPQVSGSTAAPAPSALSTLQTYQQERQTLAQQQRTLISQGATRQQLQAWRQQNAAQFQALQQLAQSLSQASALQPMPVTRQANIPPNASATLADFLTTQASLENARAQIHNQLLQALPSGATQEQVSAMQQQERQIFQQQYAADLQLQAQQAQTLAAESASQPVPVPGPPVIPPNATPQLQAYLTERNALATSRAQLWNQYITADPAARQAAMQQWRQQNAGRLQQLRELLQESSNSTATQEGENQ